MKSVKKIVSENIDNLGNLQTDTFTSAILQSRITLCRFLLQNPTQILYNNNLKDGIPCAPGSLFLCPKWIKTRVQREILLSKKYIVGGELWIRGIREKDKLALGDNVSLQSMAEKSKNHLNMSGVVVDVAGPES